MAAPSKIFGFAFGVEKEKFEILRLSPDNLDRTKESALFDSGRKSPPLSESEIGKDLPLEIISGWCMLSAPHRQINNEEFFGNFTG